MLILLRPAKYAEYTKGPGGGGGWQGGFKQVDYGKQYERVKALRETLAEKLGFKEPEKVQRKQLQSVAKKVVEVERIPLEPVIDEVLVGAFEQELELPGYTEDDILELRELFAQWRRAELELFILVMDDDPEIEVVV